MKRKIILVSISICLVLIIAIISILLIKGKADSSTDSTDRFSSREECLEYIDSQYSFEWIEEWKRQGLVYLYYENEALTPEDIEIIQANDYDILSLFPSYFDKAFASDNEISAAEKISGLLTKYIVEKYGEDTLLTCQASDYLNEWLASTDLGIVYEDPFAATMQSYQFDRDSYYSIVAITERGEYIYIQPLENYRFLTSPFEVRSFLNEFMEGTKAMLSYLEKEGPISYEAIISQIPDKVEIYFDKTTSYVRRNQVSVQTTVLVFTEMVHVWLYSETINSWQNYGISALLPLLSYPDQHMYQTVHYYGFQEYFSRLEAHADITDEPGSRDELLNDAACLYVFLYGMPETVEEIDLYLFYECVAKVQYLYMYEGGHGDPFGQIGAGKSSSLRNGNELTYYQAMFFVDFLIQQEGLDAYLQSYLDSVNSTDFKKTYGESYPMLKAAFEEQFVDYEQIRNAIDSIKTSFD